MLGYDDRLAPARMIIKITPVRAGPGDQNQIDWVAAGVLERNLDLQPLPIGGDVLRIEVSAPEHRRAAVLDQIDLELHAVALAGPPRFGADAGRGLEMRSCQDVQPPPYRRGMRRYAGVFKQHLSRVAVNIE